MTTLIYDSSKLEEIKDKLMQKNQFSGTVASINTTGLHDVRVRDIIVGMANHDIEPYLNNRGGAVVSSKTVKSVEEELHLASLGQFTAKIEKNGKKIIGDGHSRGEGLLRRFMNNKTTEKEMDYPISLKLINPSEFTTVYEKQNSGEKHTPIQRIMNPDYFMGAQMKRLANYLGEEIWNSFIKPKFYKQLTYVLWVYRKEAKLRLPSYVSYASLFGSRRYTTPLELVKKESSPFTVTDKMIEYFGEGIRFYCEVIDRVKNILATETIVNPKSIKKVYSSAPLMLMIVSDHMSGMNDFSNSSLLLSKRIVRNVDDLASWGKNLTASSLSETEKAEFAARKLLIGKTSK